MTQKLNILIQGVDLELENLISQFKTAPKDWFAIHLKSAGISLEKWRKDSSAQLIENLFRNTFSEVTQAIFAFLENGELFLFGQGERVDVKRLGKQFGVFLSDKQDHDLSYQSYHLDNAGELAAFLSCYNRYKSALVEMRQKATPASFDLTVSPSMLARRQQQKELHVLVLEDDVATAKLLSYTIARECRVAQSHTAEQAKKAYEEQAPHMVFLDIGLPDVDGLTVLEGVTKADPDAFVVMLTANGFAENVKKAVANGAKGFIVKPFAPDKINAYVKKCKEQYRL